MLRRERAGEVFDAGRVLVMLFVAACLASCRSDGHDQPRPLVAVRSSTPQPVSAPTPNPFERIYELRLWGQSAEGEPLSGAGSTSEFTVGYRAFLEEFLERHEILSVVDAGSGDWEFSKLIDWGSATCLGIDISRGMIDRTQRLYGSDRVRFELGDLRRTLPAADLLICKDVLQHLSNDEVHAFLRENLRSGRYSWALISNDRSDSGPINRDI